MVISPKKDNFEETGPRAFSHTKRINPFVMELPDNQYTRALTMSQVDNAVRFDVPIPANHPFYTDFADVRGDFEDRMIYKALNVNPKTFVFDRQANSDNKSLIFLAGMRGSGKTSELAKVTAKLHRSEAFFCITCNLDVGLDVSNMEYMDVLVFQLERLFEELDKQGGIKLETPIIESLQQWFGERVKEANKLIKKEGGLEIEIKAETPSLLSFLGLAGKLKANLVGTRENADKVRTVLKNNFREFAAKFNEFIEYVNMVLRRNGQAQELLFVVDGLEKVATKALRYKIVIEENNRFRQIKANTIFTLPIELMAETQRLYAQSNNVIAFPFVKLRERTGEVVEAAVDKFTEFIYKRLDRSLFDGEATVRRAVLYGGGSPRELLRVLEYANLYADDLIDGPALDKAIKKLAAQTSQYLTEGDLKVLKELKLANEVGDPVPFNAHYQDLLEKLIVLEYNDGTYKRVNPVVEESQLYQRYVNA